MLDFNKQYERPARPAYKSSHLFTKERNLVVLTFQDVPYGKNFRWGKAWWKKIGIKYGINEEQHEFEIPPNHLVGVHLKDLTKKDREGIVNIKNE